MAEKVSIKIPSHLAVYVRAETAAADKLAVICGAVQLPPAEWVTLLFFLCYDKDPEVRAAALAAMKGLPPALAGEIARAPATHPKLAELLAKLHPIAIHPLPADEGRQPAAAAMVPPEGAAPVEEEEEAAPVEEEEEAAPVEEEVDEEEYRSKYQLAQTMGVGEKIKMALTGDKEWRSILIKDSNKLVNGAVVKNPRITEPEILAISKSAIQNDEILRVICHNKEWVKNYEIRKALVLNHKTPLPVALRFMSFLTEKDIAGMAKSKNIASVLVNQARRMLTNKKKT